MKKAIMILLALVMVLSLAACGNGSKKIEAELQGKWEYSGVATVTNIHFKQSYEFSNGKVTYIFSNGIFDDDIKQGTYTIGDGTITISGDKDTNLEYRYINNTLTIIDGTKNFTKVS